MLASIFAPAKKANFIIHTCIGRGNTVVAERTDQWDWTGSGHWEMELHVTGIFELTPDGLIYEWREYYDNEVSWSGEGGVGFASRRRDLTTFVSDIDHRCLLRFARSKYWRNHHGPSLVWTPHANKPQPRSKSSSETTVRKFIEGWSLKDADYLMSLMSDDIVYINQPLPPVVGQKDVKKIVKGIIDLTHGKVEWKLLNLFATSDGSVICCELDVINLPLLADLTVPFLLSLYLAPFATVSDSQRLAHVFLPKSKQRNDSTNGTLPDQANGNSSCLALACLRSTRKASSPRGKITSKPRCGLKREGRLCTFEWTERLRQRVAMIEHRPLPLKI